MRWYYTALVTALCALCVWGGFGLTRHVIVAIDQWGNAAPDLRPTLDAIDRPCGTGKPCGLLANLNKAVVDTKDAIVVTQIQERQIAPHTVAAMDTLKAAATHMSGTADALTGTANAATGTAQALTGTLEEGKRALFLSGPLLESFTRSGDDLDALLKQNADPLHQIIVHSAGMSASGDKMMSDAQWKTHQLIHPDKVRLGLWGSVWAAVKAIHDIEPPIF